MCWQSKLRLFLSVSFLLFSTALCADPSSELDVSQVQGQHFLLTYPRSGTNLTSCYVQFLTKRPIKFLFDETTRFAANRLNIALDYSKPVLYRTHSPKKLANINAHANKLIYILRNYKESIFRNNHKKFAHPEDFRKIFKNNGTIVKEYMEGLQTYDAWDPSLRLLVHYEDLLTDPMTVVPRILEFLDEPVCVPLSEEVLHDISARTLASYDVQHKETGGSHSKGEELLYHTKNFPIEVLKEIDASVERNYPVLWKNYLKRYKS